MAWTIKKPDYKVSDEVARAQITAILEYYQIDVEGIPDADLKRATTSALDKLVGFVRQGMVEVKEPFAIVQHLQHPPGNERDISYGELKGKHLTSMDAHEPRAFYKRVYALMGSLSGWGDDAFQAIGGSDLSAAICLGMLFLSA